MNIALGPGSVFSDRFVIVQVLGAGGMGSVYKAKQVGLERVVALKVMNSMLVAESESESRFLREAKILSLLNHANIAKFYQYDVYDKQPFIAMEFVDGESLRQHLQDRDSFPWKEAVVLATQVCEALSYAHAHGIIHRDLKPENIILSGDPLSPKIVLIDFGLSKITDPQLEELQKLTRTGDLIGSINYLSPELCRGFKPDSRADVYALGVILYEMLTGKPPFQSDSPVGVVYKHSHETPAAFAGKSTGIPAEIQNVVFKCMAKNPDDRYQSAKELEIDLQHLLKEEFNKIENVPTISRRNESSAWLMPAAIVAGIAIIAAGAFAYLLKTNQSKTNPDDAITTRAVSDTSSSNSILAASPEVRLKNTFSLVMQDSSYNTKKLEAIADIDSFRSRLRSRQSLFAAEYMQGYLYYAVGNVDKALKSMDRAISYCREKDGRLAGNAVQPLMQSGRILLARKPEEAQKILEQAYGVMKNTHEDETYPVMDMPGEFDEMPHMDPEYYVSYMLAQLYGKNRKFDLAEKFCAQAKSSSHSNAAGQVQCDLLRVEWLEKQGKPAEARKLADSIIVEGAGARTDHEKERAREACYILGNWYFDHGDESEARTWYKQAFTICGPFQPGSSLNGLLVTALEKVDRKTHK